MQKYSLTDLVEFNNNRFNPKVLINEPGYRMVLISMLAGQLILEHATPHNVTIYARSSKLLRIRSIDRLFSSPQRFTTSRPSGVSARWQSS